MVIWLNKQLVQKWNITPFQFWFIILVLLVYSMKLSLLKWKIHCNYEFSFLYLNYDSLIFIQINFFSLYFAYIYINLSHKFNTYIEDSHIYVKKSIKYNWWTLIGTTASWWYKYARFLIIYYFMIKFLSSLVLLLSAFA